VNIFLPSSGSKIMLSHNPFNLLPSSAGACIAYFSAAACPRNYRTLQPSNGCEFESSGFVIFDMY
jgi:hypothetical protein